MRPLHQRLQHRDFNGDGRTGRASLQRVTRQVATRLALIQRTHYPCVPTTGYWSCRSTTDALSLDTIRASLQRVTRYVVIRLADLRSAGFGLEA